MGVPTLRKPWARVATGVEQAGADTDGVAHRRRIVRSALSLFGTTLVTSGMGFAFWAVATHVLSLSAVGAGSAAISAMQLLAIAGMLGLGTLLIGELSKRELPPAPLITTALLTSGAVGSALGLAYAGVIDVTSPSAGTVPVGITGAVLFSAAVGVGAALLVLDDATVGLSRPSWQFWRNVAFSLLKLAILAGLALGLHAGGAGVLVESWLAGSLISLGLVLQLARRASTKLVARPQRRLIKAHGGSALTHHWLNLAASAPRLLLPVLVAGFLTPAVNASFYAALLLVGFAYIVPSHLSTSLFAIAAGDTGTLTGALRSTVRIAVAVSVVAGLGFVLLGGVLLGVFGHDYARAAGPLEVLGTATFATGVKSFYIAVCRVEGSMRRCAAICCVGSVFEIVVPAVALALGGGTMAVAVSWVAAMSIEAVVLWPAVAAAGQLPGRIPDRFVGLVRWSSPGTWSVL